MEVRESVCACVDPFWLSRIDSGMVSSFDWETSLVSVSGAAADDLRECFAGERDWCSCVFFIFFFLGSLEGERLSFLRLV